MTQYEKITEALKGMEKVAEHINEMQRIHEEYGAIFDHLFRQHQKSCKQPIDGHTKSECLPFKLILTNVQTTSQN